MNYKHGCASISGRKKGNPLWKAHYTWLGLKARCDNPRKRDYHNYGGRGITYETHWSTFENFLRDMGQPPTADHTIERIDSNGPYSKANCRWATRTEQNRNRSMNRNLEFNGETMIISEWAERLGVNARLLRVRLNRGWTVERTLSTPVAA